VKEGYLLDFAARLAALKHAKSRSERSSCTDLVLVPRSRLIINQLRQICKECRTTCNYSVQDGKWRWTESARYARRAHSLTASRLERIESSLTQVRSTSTKPLDIAETAAYFHLHTNSHVYQRTSKRLIGHKPSPAVPSDRVLGVARLAAATRNVKFVALGRLRKLRKVQPRLAARTVDSQT